MRVTTFLFPLTLLAVLSGSSPVAAGLIDRGNGLIYDSVLDVTWLQNADLFATQEGPHYNGDLAEQKAWIQNLVYAGFDDWRPATMSRSAEKLGLFWNHSLTVIDCDPSSGTTEAECIDNELAYMYFYNLGGDGRYDWFDSGDNLISPSGITFFNVNNVYYSNTSNSPHCDPWIYPFCDPSDYLWGFYFADGFQGDADGGSTPAFWAVRDGDSRTNVSKVSSPGTAALTIFPMLSFAAAQLLRRRRHWGASREEPQIRESKKGARLNN
jgi:hypothetical protein